MKKVVAVLLAAVLTVGASMTAFAAPSPSASGVGVSSATDKNGNAVEVSISTNFADPAEQAAADELISAPETVLTEVLGADVAANADVLSVMDVTVPEGTQFPVTLTFNVPGVTAGSDVYVLHYNGSAWENIAAKAGDGTVTATFTSLSPVAIVVADAAGAGADTNTGANAGTTTDQGTSPKTGESQFMVWVAIIAAAGIAGMTVTYRKNRA